MIEDVYWFTSFGTTRVLGVVKVRSNPTVRHPSRGDKYYIGAVDSLVHQKRMQRVFMLGGTFP